MTSLRPLTQAAQSLAEYSLLLLMVFGLAGFFTLTVSGEFLNLFTSFINSISF